jgi:hypothetical protein
MKKENNYQEILCKNNITKLSTCKINENTTSVMFHFGKNDSSFEMDALINIPLHLEQISIYAKYRNGKCSGNLIGNIYEALRSITTLKRLYITMITDNTNWNNFEKLTLEGIAMHHHENVNNQIIFPPSSKYVVFNAFEFTINDFPELCKNYMIRAFCNKPPEIFWEWSVNCNYNPDYQSIFCLLDNTYKFSIYGTN